MPTKDNYRRRSKSAHDGDRKKYRSAEVSGKFAQKSSGESNAPAVLFCLFPGLDELFKAGLFFMQTPRGRNARIWSNESANFSHFRCREEQGKTR